MSVSERLGQVVPAKEWPLPADLVVIVLHTLVTVGVLLVPLDNGTLLRSVLGLSFVVFAPGYAVMSVLFPERYRSTEPAGDTSTTKAGGVLLARFRGSAGIDPIERAALAFGTSMALVPLVGIALGVTPWGIRLLPIVWALGGVTLIGVLIATVRRLALPEDRRFSVPYRRWISAARSRVFDADTGVDAFLTVALAASVLLTAGSVTYAVAASPDGEDFSDFYVLTEDASGELVAADYPTELVAGEPEPMVVGIENHEGVSTEYTIIVEIQDVTLLGDNRVQVDDRQRVTTLEPTVDSGETWQTEHDLVSTMTGRELRVSYLLYVGEPPAEPTTDNADQSLQLWVDVAPSRPLVDRTEL